MYHFAKGLKNGCPCIVEIRGIQGYALVGDRAPAWSRAIGGVPGRASVSAMQSNHS